MTGSQVDTLLVAWGQAMDDRLRRGQPEAVAPLAQVVLQRFPRHLATYTRLLEALWQLARWEEGEEWGRRLLQADPCHGLGWRAVGQAIEQRGDRAAARAIWQRAAETDPYQSDIRAGLARTTLGPNESLRLSQAGLATLYLRGYRWRHAAAASQALVAADRRRIDFQVNLAIALWRLPDPASAYTLARRLAQTHPLLLLPWYILAHLGNEDDRALAHNPLATMDPDGEYVCQMLRLDRAPPAERALAQRLYRPETRLAATPDEAEFLAIEAVV